MNLDLSDEETALLKELNGLIGGNRYFLSPRVKMLKAIRAKIRPEPVREALPPPPKRYEPPRATARQRRRGAPAQSLDRVFLGGGRRSDFHALEGPA
jgi:hypothetical protein